MCITLVLFKLPSELVLCPINLHYHLEHEFILCFMCHYWRNVKVIREIWQIILLWYCILQQKDQHCNQFQWYSKDQFFKMDNRCISFWFSRKGWMMNTLRGKMRIMRIISYNIFYHYTLRTRFHLIEEGERGVMWWMAWMESSYVSWKEGTWEWAWRMMRQQTWMNLNQPGIKVKEKGKGTLDSRAMLHLKMRQGKY